MMTGNWSATCTISSGSTAIASEDTHIAAGSAFGGFAERFTLGSFAVGLGARSEARTPRPA